MALTEKEKEYQRKWRSTQKCKDYQREYKKKYAKTPQRIAYVKQYVRTPGHKARNDKWVKENPEKIKAKFQRYSKTDKGQVKYLKSKDKRKFGFVHEDFTIELINYINERDGHCVYCGCELSKDFKNKNFEYDHFNPYKPFSRLNMVKSCKFCNRSKMNADVLQWMKYMKLIPSKFVLELYKETYL